LHFFVTNARRSFLINMSDKRSSDPSVSRREFVGSAIAGGVATVLPAGAQTPEASEASINCTLTINGQQHEFQLDPRVTLLDLLRERLHLTGTKKGCDHGQCGACTVLLNGKRINSCLTLAVMRDGDQVTTIEGLANGANLHPMQAAFIEHDGLQCGYCTPGQICSAVALLDEVRAGAPSVVTPNLADVRAIELTGDEIRERMSGNICRCGAYPNIVAAVRAVAQGRNA
jgi:xanthine dehydrogenase YagT iron-sulfur-binding subunit